MSEIKFGLSQKCYQDIRAVFEKFPEIERVIIFGSRAMGTQKNGSDIDLVLFGNYLQIKIISKIRVFLSKLPYAYTYDILIFDQISNLAVKEHIEEQGKEFYRRKLGELS